MPLSDFIIGDLIGKGTFSSVNLVKRKIDNQTYAMKRVKIIQLQEKEKQNALNEIRILASLNHKNIIGYKEAFFDEETQTLNIIMEYANDGDLSTKIKYNLKNGLIFRENIIWSYIIQILEGINYLHENKIIHRDLKSANLFLMKDGTLKIGDLNVSKIAKMGIAFTQAGTPYYASPEVWLDKSYDNKSDIWSIGCIIYELCMLKTPFRGTSMKNLCLNIQKGEYEDICNFYSDDLRKVIQKMLVVNPDFRFSAFQILNLDFVLKKRNLGGKIVIKEEKADLIKTIKMPKNLREINRNLPMKRYGKISNQEMFMNDEYETMKSGFLNDDEKNEVRKYIYGNKDLNMYKQINVNHNKINYHNNNYNHYKNIVKNPWENDNYKHNYEYYKKQMEINNYIKNSENGKSKKNEPVNNYNKVNCCNNNKNILEKINQPKNHNSISPSKKYNNNMYNRNNNDRKIDISQKSRPKTGNNLIHHNLVNHHNNSINYNRINKSNNRVINIKKINDNKKDIQNLNRPISAIPYRKAYIYKINNNYSNNNNNRINKSNNYINNNSNSNSNSNNKKRSNTGNSYNRMLNIKKKIDNIHQYKQININNYNIINNVNYYPNRNQSQNNNNFKLKNGRDVVMINPQNKKKKVIIEKLDYKSNKQNKNLQLQNNKYLNININNIQKGKNDRMKEYEKERLKNRNNRYNIYNNNKNYKKIK